MANYCENEGFQPGLLELQDKNTGNHMVLDVSKGTFTCKDEQAKVLESVLKFTLLCMLKISFPFRMRLIMS